MKHQSGYKKKEKKRNIRRGFLKIEWNIFHVVILHWGVSNGKIKDYYSCFHLDSTVNFYTICA